MIYLSPDLPEQARYWRNHPDIMRWCRQNALLAWWDHNDWYDRLSKDPSLKMFGIAKSENPKTSPTTYYGVCGLTSISMVHRTAEFSLYIAPEYQGGGYGEEALKQLLKYGFHNLGLNRIFGEVFDHNPAMTMFKRVGFVEEGHLRETYYKEGRFIGSTIISILRSEYDLLYPRT